MDATPALRSSEAPTNGTGCMMVFPIIGVLLLSLAGVCFLIVLASR